MTNIKEIQKIIVLDYGSQYNQLITRRIRELGVFSELVSHRKTAQEIKDLGNVIGVILSGGPHSVNDEDAFTVDPAVFELGIPVLGVCYGMQLTTQVFGGVVEASAKREFGQGQISISNTETGLFKALAAEETVLMSHGDKITQIPEGFVTTASTPHTPYAAFENPERQIYGVQFHPEVRATLHGNTMLQNFVFDICGANGDWNMENFIDLQVEQIRQKVGDRHVLLALSGGVDSSVVGVLLQKAIGNQLVCIFVDHGLLRKNEADHVMTSLGQFGLNIIHINAKDRFFAKLAGVADPEQKRKIIGNEFIRVFDDEAAKLEGIDFLAQGTLYTDIIESGTETAQTIKSHHNVGGLPEDMQFELIEPLNTLFKDEVRALGTALGMPDSIVWRQPFPGPGLGIRVLGEITDEKVNIVRESDAILREVIAEHGLERDIWQYFTVLPGVRSVGVMGDGRTYDHMVGIRAVTSIDGMTSEFAEIPWDVLAEISKRIVNEVPHVNRVVYDITGKPPATIEWE
ncbi:GMP synthase (glutamine-hydrolysing) [Ignavigranum ruoffiae]|uniref:GMP synthase [glutamine-hydrolyzing] n=1 Tax=Ignavigranum ruoffiae TaxID=89093 RepID=A0A1H9G210_9LACT|nr:glutamine-hydrolyzing GMP synthase [Ignavigranum ruoffiae]SEQ44136.1 GMP synthase (glutamine-hydrolysing) [Ignavigranum ruoffiae]